MKKPSPLLVLIWVSLFFGLTSSCSNKIVQTNEIKSIKNKSLVAYYPFNGNANDQSGKYNHGRVLGALLTYDRFGNINSAFEFDGIDDYIEVSSSRNLQIKNKITMSAWFKTNYVIPYAGIICKANPTEPRVGYMMDIDAGNKARADVMYNHQTGDDGCVTSKNSVTDGNWHHMLAVYNGRLLKLYIDGKLDSQIIYSKGMDKNREPLLIGWDENTWLSHRHFSGSIDDIRIFNRVLTETEILYLYNESSSIK